MSTEIFNFDSSIGTISGGGFDSVSFGTNSLTAKIGRSKSCWCGLYIPIAVVLGSADAEINSVTVSFYGYGSRTNSTLYSPTVVNVGYYSSTQGYRDASSALELGMGVSKATYHTFTISDANQMRRYSASQGGEVLCPCWKFTNPNSTVDVTNYLTGITIAIDYSLPTDKTNNIFIGTVQPNDIYIGSQKVREVFIGTTKIFG